MMTRQPQRGRGARGAAGEGELAAEERPDDGARVGDGSGRCAGQRARGRVGDRRRARGLLHEGREVEPVAIGRIGVVGIGQLALGIDLEGHRGGQPDRTAREAEGFADGPGVAGGDGVTRLRDAVGTQGQDVRIGEGDGPRLGQEPAAAPALVPGRRALDLELEADLVGPAAVAGRADGLSGADDVTAC